MVTDRTNFISLSKACKNKNLSVRKVLDDLITNSIIPITLKHKKFNISKPIKIISNGDTLKIIEDQFISYLEENYTLYDLSFNDESTDVMDMIDDIYIFGLIDSKKRYKDRNCVLLMRSLKMEIIMKLLMR